MMLTKEAKSAAAAYILGLSPLTKVKGTKNEIKAFTAVLSSSKVLYDTLNESAVSHDRIAEALADKSAKAKTFAKVCGQTWPF